MTERAKRAATELRRLGWSLTEEDGAISTECGRCGGSVLARARYCSNCGERIARDVTADAIADIEAAIVAALHE